MVPAFFPHDPTNRATGLSGTIENMDQVFIIAFFTEVKYNLGVNVKVIGQCRKEDGLRRIVTVGPDFELRSCCHRLCTGYSRQCHPQQQG